MPPTSHRRVKLTPELQGTFVANVHDCFRVRLTASDAHEMPVAIFAYRLIPLQPGQATQVAIFDHVCSPVDLQEYPIAAPRAVDAIPWFRLEYVDLEERTRAAALETLDVVVADVAALVLGMDAADVLVAQAAIWVGYTPAEAAGQHSSVGSEGSLN